MGKILAPFLTSGALLSIPQVVLQLKHQKLNKSLRQKENQNKKRNKHHPHHLNKKNKKWIWATSSVDSL